MKKLLLLFCLLIAAGTAGAQCTAVLTAAHVPTGNNLLNVDFTNTSYYGLPFSGQKMKFDITYGDATGLSNYQGTSVPSHNYAFPGTYYIGFRIYSYDSASNSTVCTDSTTDTVTVAYPPCGATMTVTGTGTTRSFTANNPAGTPNMSYSWNYGDGNTGTGSFVSHTYTATGTYTVTLTATNGSCTYVNTTSIYIYVPPPALNCGTLHANFVYSVSSNVVSFTNTSTAASSLYQSIGTWDYGDGTFGAGFNTPPHTYTAPGVYSVKLVMHWKDSLNTTSCKDSITKVVTITTVPSPANIISGNVYYDTTLGFNFFKVYLLKEDTSTGLLSIVDSVQTGNTATPYYAFGYKVAGKYRVKAMVWNAANPDTGFVPTYHDSSVYWGSATPIIHAGGSTLNKRIYVRNGLTNTGTGSIGGNISLGSSKGAATGVKNILVFLRNANMRVVQFTYTDSNGNYSFPNIALGAYSIWPEKLNYSTMPKTPLVLNATYPTRTDIDFYQDDLIRHIAPKGSLGVSGTTTASSDFITVAPVPATDQVTISWSGLNDATAQFTVTNMTGQIVARTAMLQGKTGSVSLSLNGLSHGVYFVHGSGSLAGKVARLVIQ